MKVSIIPWIVKKLKLGLALVEDGDTSSQNIASGKYVSWKGNMCQASSAISSGDALSSSNLTAVDGGALNALNGNKTKGFLTNPVTVTLDANTTWTATDTGVLRALVTWDTSGSNAYAYFKDNTADNIVAQLSTSKAGGLSLSTIIPVISGHVYAVYASAHVQTFNNHFYKFS